MADLLAQLQRAYAGLCALDGRCALVGGFAYGLHVEPRMTKDIDFAVGVADDREAEDLMRSLHRSGYRIAQLLEHKELGRLVDAEAAAPAVDLGDGGGRPPLRVLWHRAGDRPRGR